MDTSQLRKEIDQYLEQADDRLLQLVHGLIKAVQSATVGYRADSSPISKNELIARAEVAEEDIKSGRVKSLKVLQEKVKNW